MAEAHSQDDHQHAHDATDEEVLKTPLWMPIVGLLMLLSGAVLVYSKWFNPNSSNAPAIIQLDAGSSPTAPAPAPTAP